MIDAFLSETDKKELLGIARDAITHAVRNEQLKKINLQDYSPFLRTTGASFVTLTIRGKLRGCIGTLEAYQPLVLDIQEHAVAAAMEDYRFPVVREEELQLINIEISILTPIQLVEYSTPSDLMSKLRIHVDGVLIESNGRRATFLPQVWEKIEDSDQFLSQLCLKMGAPPDLWRKKHIQAYTYQVEKFKEA
ncbi:MAG: AmmeMemoRadiSam system protein A [Anaerolineaceae bacterium]|nr:AmmeMemoRadiSam system protein A [Anaerolineaceae bacterium]